MCTSMQLALLSVPVYKHTLYKHILMNSGVYEVLLSSR